MGTLGDPPPPAIPRSWGQWCWAGNPPQDNRLYDVYNTSKSYIDLCYPDSHKYADESQKTALAEEWGTSICPPLLFNGYMLVQSLTLTLVVIMPWQYHLLVQGSQEGWGLPQFANGGVPSIVSLNCLRPYLI